jgi:hypothetical protein
MDEYWAVLPDKTFCCITFHKTLEEVIECSKNRIRSGIRVRVVNDDFGEIY